jgi:hypothetical protein
MKVIQTFGTSNPPGAPTVTPIAPGSSEFERFKDFARKLVNIPEAEIDAKREEDAQPPVSSA